MKLFRRQLLKQLLFGGFTLSTLGVILMKFMNNNKKKVKFSYGVKDRHWVGDGFYVHGLLRPSEKLNQFISPFILMDYASPMRFESTDRPKGVGEHPHRGFETVTFAYQGEVEHLDSSGGGGVIGTGDVQWMTAASGVVHNEFHSKAFSKKGGIFEMVQLWINLPAKYKMSKPKYQGIKNQNIPEVKIQEGATLRVVAGNFNGTKGPAKTYTEINIFDLKSTSSNEFSFTFKKQSNTILLILSGSVVNDKTKYEEKNVVIFDHSGENISFKSSENFKGLLLNGDPINEPMVAHGPFVMNTVQEINEAILDYQNGKMGKL